MGVICMTTKCRLFRVVYGHARVGETCEILVLCQAMGPELPAGPNSEKVAALGLRFSRNVDAC